jgi:hypothetical protein
MIAKCSLPFPSAGLLGKIGHVAILHSFAVTGPTKGVGGRVEQDVVDLSFVLIGDDGDLVGDREDHVEIFRIEQFSLAILDPLGAGQ